MLLTLTYLYMWLRFHRCYAALIRSSLSRLQRSRLSFGFCLSSSPAPGGCPRPQTSAQGRSSPPEDHGVFLQLGDRTVYVTEPQACCDLSKWTLFPPSLARVPSSENVSFIIEATAGGALSPRKTNTKVLRWSDCCLPLACCGGAPYRAVALSSVEDFSRLGVAFIEDRLQLDHGLRPLKITPVLLPDSELSQLLDKRRSQSVVPSPQASLCSLSVEENPVPSPQASLCLLSVEENPLLCRKGSLYLSPGPRSGVRPGLEERRSSEPVRGAPSLCEASVQQHMEEHGHHLHLSSCHECLQLENSTILSVKYASAEDVSELPDDEAPEPLRRDSEDGGGRGLRHKPPNVLVFTGGSEERFEAVRRVLSDCVDLENHLLYHLRPQQALTDPWLDNCVLLVLAEENALSDHLQTRFLTYLSGGGRLLGLSSGLCPAGLSLGAQRGSGGPLGTMSFTREDSSSLELSVLCSGRVYLRDVRGGGEVEVWGELTGDGHADMVIVRVTHGDDGGEAVLCQVHLEKSPERQSLSSEGFAQLKVTNALRYEVLTEILTSLGLSCEVRQPPMPSAVHLLTTSQEVRRRALDWFRSEADTTGLMSLPKLSLRLTSISDPVSVPVPDLPDGPQSLSDGPLSDGPLSLSDGPQSDGPLSLLWDSPDAPCPDHFSVHTYRSHLRTRVLGQTLLYAEVTSSTMDLLDGLNLRAPPDLGLVAVAARQNQGRGRSRNGWLSPVGCAMFTASLQVALGSRLGQRIPFLQHLTALAVVEAVRTLPGYEDIDLRVKWPNDIYYSGLMKLGGVLVTSTVLGSTFHLLIGCGFNVTNSNPTMCINDLVEQYNRDHGTHLVPLSCAQLIARSLTVLETLIDRFQKDGSDGVLPTYYSRWLHSGTRVRLWSDDGPEADVVGLDENGFLQVHSPERGLLSVEPDGNSFDMLRNLLVMKH